MNKYYEILGIQQGATKEEIKAAYRIMAHKYHPDKPDGDEGKMKLINNAYQALTILHKDVIIKSRERTGRPVYNEWMWARYSYGQNINVGFDYSTTAGTTT